jgi:predicted neuraminidase
LAFNNDPKERDDMTLAISRDQAQTWQIMQTIESNKLIPADNSQQFSYPWLLQTQNGTIHLLYTWHKNHIKHIAFNRQWLFSKPSKQILPAHRENVK